MIGVYYLTNTFPIQHHAHLTFLTCSLIHLLPPAASCTCSTSSFLCCSLLYSSPCLYCPVSPIFTLYLLFSCSLHSIAFPSASPICFSFPSVFLSPHSILLLFSFLLLSFYSFPSYFLPVSFLLSFYSLPTIPPILFFYSFLFFCSILLFLLFLPIFFLFPYSFPSILFPFSSFYSPFSSFPSVSLSPAPCPPSPFLS